jgi:type VII secretion-associated serine protease mycosin
MRRAVQIALAVAVVATACVLPAAPAAAAGCGPNFSSPLTDQPWPLKRLRPDLVWPITQGNDIVVAVIDSGVSNTHPALAGQVLPGLDLIAGNGPGTCDDVGHGTIIAGIIAAKPLANSAYYGMAPGAKILPLKVLDSADRSFDQQLPSRIARAIRVAVQMGASVINLSLTTVPIPDLADAVKFAISHNVIVVAAAGNDGGTQQSGQLEYPAAYPGVIAVAGVNQAGDHVQSSSSGSFVDVAAPGEHIEGPSPQGGGYVLEAAGGTSFAAAYVSGLAALVRYGRPDLSATEVAERIIRTADRPAGGWDSDVGNGVINPYWAVMSAAATEDEVSTAGSVALPAPKPDPLARTRGIAVATTAVCVVLAILVLASVGVMGSGRRRRWIPGRPAADPDD